MISNFKKLFSIKEEDLHYVIRILGLKLKLKNSKKVNKEFRKMQLQLKRLQIPSIYTTKLNTQQKIWFLSQKFYEEVGYFPNLKNPKSFNEKINWLKLNYYNPLEDICIDKYTMKEYIKAKLGKGYIIPTLGIYEDVNDIDFDNLPNSFVIKVTTSGSGEGVEIVKNKNKINIDKLKYKFNNLLQEWNTIYYYCLSRGYKNIKPRILIEKYVEQRNKQLYDYKVFCFNGEPKFVYVATDHFPGQISKISFYSLDWKRLDISYNNHSQVNITILKPKHYKEMLEFSKILSKEFPFVRIDFYETDDNLYIGELTFTPGGGFGKYEPSEWDYKIGEYLDLNKIEKEFLNVQNN